MEKAKRWLCEYDTVQLSDAGWIWTQMPGDMSGPTGGCFTAEDSPLPTCRLVCLESITAVRGLWTPPTSLLCNCLTLAAKLGIWQQPNPQRAIR